MTGNKPSISHFLAASVIISLSTAYANDQKPDMPTPDSEIVVTATRDERQVERAPYYASITSAEEILIENASRTVPDALKSQTAVMIQKTSYGQGSPYIRGFTGFRTLFLIDGVRLNNSTFRDGPNQYWNTVDASSLSKLECVKGPFSVLYGSDAVGGTVNAFTEGITLRPDSSWDRHAYYRYSSAENSHIGRLDTTAMISENTGLTLGLTSKTFGDLRGGQDVGKQKKTGYDELDWDAKLQYFIDDDSLLVVAHNGVNQNDAWRTHKTVYGIDWKGLSKGDELRRALDQDRSLTYIQYHQLNIGGPVDEVHAGASYHIQKEVQDRLRTRNRRDLQGYDVHTAGAFIQLKSPAGIGNLVYGADYYRDNVDSYNKSLNTDGSVKSYAIQGPVADDASYDTFGAYIQDTIALNDDLTLILGCRYDSASADADRALDPNTGSQMAISGDWNTTVGSGRILYNLNENKTVNLFAGASQGFRAPNLSDLTRLDTARTKEIETPSPNLDPEYFTSYEIGIKARTDGLAFQAAYFYTDIRDMIVRTPTGRIIDGDYEVTKKNAGDGYIHGIEIEAHYGLSASLSAFASFTWMYGEMETYPASDPVLVEEPVDRIMPPSGRAGMRWSLSDKNWIEASFSAAARADKLSSAMKADTSRIPPGGTPGYAVCDIRTGYRISNELNVSVAVENVADEDYRIHGSGVNESGRNLVLAADWIF